MRSSCVVLGNLLYFFLKCSVSRCPGCHLACVMKEGEREEMH